MCRSKKFIIIGIIATVLVTGVCLGGVALAQDSEDESQPTTAVNTLWDKVATILQNEGVNVSSEQLKNAFTQAQKEMQTEALQDYLQNLVEQGKITQEQADQYFEWWQAKPDMEQYRQQLEEWFRARPGVPPEFKEWREATPDIPLPGPLGRFGGMGRMRVWSRLCAPAQ